jgi:hypothetical protein
MRRRILVRASIVVAWMGAACAVPARCHAQADTNPDVYEARDSKTAANSARNGASGDVRSKVEFGGQFTLPYDAHCAGVKLAAGLYFVAVDRRGKTQTVSFTRAGADTLTLRLPAKAVFPAMRMGGSAMVVRHAGADRKLEAMYVEKMKLVLYLEPVYFLDDASDPLERLPIS